MIDTHCHLTDPRLLEQLPAVLRRAAAAGVSRMITIGTDLEDDKAAIELCRKLPNVRCAVGIHPNYSADAKIEDVAKLTPEDPTVVAVGEMGLDYHYDRSPVDHQKKIFAAQLEVASKIGKPVVIHCREAVDDTLAILRDFSNVPAVFHCFTGTLDEARKIVDAGYLLGFTGPVTFKNNDDLRKVVAFVPIDRLLVETDAPYLSPEPVRKIKTNEPSFVMHTAAMCARVKNISVEELDRATTENVSKFFKWD